MRGLNVNDLPEGESALGNGAEALSGTRMDLEASCIGLHQAGAFATTQLEGPSHPEGPNHLATEWSRAKAG